MSGTHTFDCCPFCGSAITRDEDWPRVEDVFVFIGSERFRVPPQAATLLRVVLQNYPEPTQFEKVFSAWWAPNDEPLRPDFGVCSRLYEINKWLRPRGYALTSHKRRISMSRLS